MKTVLLATLLAALPVLAQQPAATNSPDRSMKLGGLNRDRNFTAWMKSTGAANGALQKMDSKVGQEAVDKAESIGSIYESMIGFWRQRAAPDAVKISMAGKAAAIELAEAAHAGKSEQAADAYKKLSATCKECHDAHRSRLADGTFMIRTNVPNLGGPRPAATAPVK